MELLATRALAPVPRTPGPGRVQQQMYISPTRPANGAEIVCTPPTRSSHARFKFFFWPLCFLAFR